MGNLTGENPQMDLCQNSDLVLILLDEPRIVTSNNNNNNKTVLIKRLPPKSLSAKNRARN